MKKDALDELIVDEDQSTNINLLASLLKGHLILSKRGDIICGEKFHEYEQWKRVILFLLARKAIVLKKLKNIKEKARNKDVSEGAFMPDKSVARVYIENLSGIVKRDKEGYYIPNYNLIRCKAILDGKQKIPTPKKK